MQGSVAPDLVALPQRDDDQPSAAPRKAWQPDRSRLAAILGFLLVALWVLRPVLPAPATLLPTARTPSRLAQLDESMVLAVTTGNAHALTHAPRDLFGFGPCFPLARSYTLGEHMFGAGVLAALPYALTGEPIAAYNVMLLLKLWIAGLGMFLFARELVGRAGPAFVAGLAFQLTPGHLGDLIHPYLSGDHFTPLAALFLRRTFVRGGAGNAVGLALCAAMAMLESFYVLVASAIVLGCYAVHLAWCRRDVLLRRLPVLAAVLAWLVVVAWVVFAPYVEMRDAFDILSARPGRLGLLRMFLTVNVVTLLALVGLVDRAARHRPRDGDDPRLAFLVAAVISLWFGMDVPASLGIPIPSALDVLAGLLPGIDAVRAPGLMGQGVWFVYAVLAAFGVLALTERLDARARAGASRWSKATALVVAAVSCLIVVERFVPPLSTLAFGLTFAPDAWPARPEEDDLRLLRATHGPILHVPMATTGVKALVAADHLRLTSFDSRPTSACYNSFGSPVVEQVAALAGKLPQRDAVDALYALGFTTVLLHLGDLPRRAAQQFEQRLAAPDPQRRLTEVGRTERLLAVSLSSPRPAHADLRALAPQPGRLVLDRSVQKAAAGEPATVRFEVFNQGMATFVHPEPRELSPVTVRWWRGGTEVASQELRVMLPLAIAGGTSFALPLTVDPPAEPGRYRVTLSTHVPRAAELASQVVELAPPRSAPS